MKKRRYREKFQIFVYKSIAVVLRRLLKWFYNLKVYGIENIPLEGPVIIAPNHRSSLDVLVIATTLPRPIKALGKIERFEYPIFGRFARYLGGIPVKRENIDLSAVKDGLEAIREGEVLLIFPEGTRLRRDNGDVKIKRGIGYFAAKTKAPVIPTAIIGADNIWPPEKKFPHLSGKIKVIYSEPLVYEGEHDRKKEEEFTNKVMEIINQILMEARIENEKD
uniref:1-acyl-sn-glycerol-3-phosphate acyltransferase n=1 Tax=Dictyoglomus thermophilum TaxID=14 RepID=A0A7C3MJ06_DICTH